MWGASWGLHTMQVLEIRGLIGYFDLDPNRAVSLVLLAFAAQPSNKAYLQLFHLFTPAATEQTLGFLFQHHAGPDNSTPDNLFVIAVALIQVMSSGLYSLPSS